MGKLRMPSSLMLFSPPSMLNTTTPINSYNLLAGFVFPEGLEAKFNKKQSRYTFRYTYNSSCWTSSAAHHIPAALQDSAHNMGRPDHTVS